jgi:hypothetical protein
MMRRRLRCLLQAVRAKAGGRAGEASAASTRRRRVGALAVQPSALTGRNAHAEEQP